MLVLCSALFILLHHYFSICYFHNASYQAHTSTALYALINPAYSSALLSLQPFLHISISFFHFHRLPLFLFRLAPHFSTFHFIPISLCLRLCVFVCMAAGCLWLFFRQQPRRLDCHNLWSWVISVSNPNLGTGPFFLSSSSPPPPLVLSLSLPPFHPSSHIIFHSSSHSLSRGVVIYFLQWPQFKLMPLITTHGFTSSLLH